MRAASLDRLLAILVVAMAATGLLTLRAGSPDTAWVFVAHGLLAGALAAAVAWKLRASLRRAVGGRRWGRLALGLVVAFAAIGALSGGYLWVAGGSPLTIGSWTVLTLHAWFGLALVPLVAVHLLPRRWRLLRPGPAAVRRAGAAVLSRRALLAAGGLAAAGVGGYAAAATLDRARRGDRRFTGSRWLPTGGVPPATTFFGEPPPSVDAAAWSVRIGGHVERPATLRLADLRRLGESDLSAVLDCTSGWAIETGWRGLSLGRLLATAGAAADARTVEVRSATGWTASLPIDEARGCLLATEVAGEPLAVANGAPLRLVVPNRRGLDWVKWVREVVVS